MQRLQVHEQNALEVKLQRAEQILDYSNRNVQLTMEILVASPQEAKPLLLEMAENGAAISSLIPKIREEAETDKERELLEAASASLSRTHSYAESLRSFVDEPKRLDVTTATSNVLLPLLLDNSSWKAFVHFLRTQLDSSGPQEMNRGFVTRTRDLLRAHQEMKSAVAERKRIGERLSQLASIIECSSDAIVLYTLDGVIVGWNMAAESIYGYSASEVLGRSRRLLIPSDQPDDLPGIVETLKQGEAVKRFETVHLRKGGQSIDVSMTISPVKDASDEIVGAAAIARDVSDRKLLERQLRQAQRMEAIGQLSGGIAHDFNNLLSVIIGHSDLLEERLAKSDALKNVEEIRKAGTHGASLIRQLLAFSRQQVLEPKVLDLNAVLTDLEKMLRRLIGEDIDLCIALDPVLGRLKADAGQIQQVIMNLAVNARDAMPHGGKLTIKTANVEVDGNYARHHPPQTPGSYIALHVSDTGIGMTPEVQAHIFEPFFTTKEVGKGTGLGLSTVYGVVKQSGGYIWPDSAPGQGTTFRIYLPRTEEAPVPSKSAVGRGESLRGAETILVVEDADALRELACNLLTMNGYKTLEANSPEEAIRIAREYPLPIHLLLTDVIMPGMNGLMLAEKLVPQRSEMKVLYMSGYTGFMDRGLHHLESMILSKPFTREALFRKIREVLG